MLSIEDARAAVLERARPLGAEEVDLELALGRTLAGDVAARDDVPAFDNSAMDGFAARAADASSGATLAIAGESAAGRPWGGKLGPGEAVAISTGAAVPAGADAVIRVEDTRTAGRGVRILAGADAGDNVRRAGEDVRRGDTVLRAGEQIGATELGVLASAGAGRVPCAQRPRLHLLATGDELHAAGAQLRPGGVRNSNGYSVAALALAAGAEVIASEVVGDSRSATEAALGRALEADVTVVCGGVSVGEHDHVKGALGALGVEEVFWRVALRPGKPTWFGELAGGPLVFGLPGNPVSAMVTFIVFARPAIRAMLGADPGATRVRAALGRDLSKPPGRAELVRCRLDRADRLVAMPTGPQGSHVLTSMLGADGLAILPPGVEVVVAGTEVDVELLPASVAGPLPRPAPGPTMG